MVLQKVDLKAILGPKPTEASRRALMAAAGYVPHPEQETFHFARNPDNSWLRFKLVAGGEQAGKSFSAAMEMLSFLPWGELFWIVGPDYSQTNTEFRYLEEALRTIGALKRSSTPEKGSWHLETIWGAEIVTKSAQNPETISGRAPDGILLVEAAQASFETLLRTLGRAGPKRGWCCINGTFENEKDSGTWYRQMWKSWQTSNPQGGRSYSLPTWTNRTFYPGGREDPEIQRMYDIKGEDWFNERYAGIPVPPKGLVFREFDFSVHVKDVKRQRYLPSEMFPDPFTVLLPEETEDEVWVDPGWENGYSVLFMTWWKEIAIVYDEIYKTHWTGEEMANAALKHPRWKYVQKVVMDVAGKQHQAGKSQFEVWKDVTKVTPLGRAVRIREGIERTRISLRPHPETKVPGLIIGTNCVKTAAEFTEGYRNQKDAQGNPTDGLPQDKNNHSAKAIAYGLVQHLGLVRREKRAIEKRQRRVSGMELLYSR